MITAAAAAFILPKSETQISKPAQTKSQPPPRVSDHEFTVKTRRDSISFSLGRGVRDLHYVATSIRADKINVSRGMGANVTVAAFTRKDTHRFLKKHPNTSICPAPFFNRNVQLLHLFAANEAVAEDMKNWHRPRYKEVDHWEEISITGRCIKDITNLIIRGKDKTELARMPRSKGAGIACIYTSIRSRKRMRHLII